MATELHSGGARSPIQTIGLPSLSSDSLVFLGVFFWPSALVRVTYVGAVKNADCRNHPRSIVVESMSLDVEPGNLYPQQAFQAILTNCILRTIAHTLLTFNFYTHLSNQMANILRSGIVTYYLLNPKNPKVCNRHLDIYYMPTQYLHFLCRQQN